jgi:hypothetical protein
MPFMSRSVSLIGPSCGGGRGSGKPSNEGVVLAG